MTGAGEGAEFARLHLRGARSDGGSKQFPVTHLIEAERYRDLVLQAARTAWQREYPGLPVPDDFATGYDLDVTDVEDGSAILVFVLTVASAYTSFFDAGRELLNQTLQAVTQASVAHLDDEPLQTETGRDEAAMMSLIDDDDKPSPQEIAAEMQDSPVGIPAFVTSKQFNNFGSTLSRHESLVVESHSVPRALVTQETLTDRVRPFVKAVKPQRQTRFSEVIAGRLTQLDADAQKFTMDTLQFGSISGRYKDPEFTEDLRLVLDSKAQAPVLRVTGKFRFERDRLVLILDLDTVSLFEVDGAPWSKRLVEIAEMRTGWDGEGALAVDFAALEGAKEVLIRQEEGSQAAIFADQSGGVGLEWLTGDGVFASLVITPDLVCEVYVHADLHNTWTYEGVGLAEAIELLNREGIL